MIIYFRNYQLFVLKTYLNVINDKSTEHGAHGLHKTRVQRNVYLKGYCENDDQGVYTICITTRSQFSSVTSVGCEYNARSDVTKTSISRG